VVPLEPVKKQLADALCHRVPAGLGSTGKVHLTSTDMDDMLSGGAQWAVKFCYGEEQDLERIEDHGCMKGAKPDRVSDHAKQRQKDEMGTLGSGNHYLEVQQVVKVFDEKTAAAFGIREGDILLSIHCGSRGLGHQIGTEFLKQMAIAATSLGIEFPIANWLTLPSIQRLVKATSEQCAPPSTARLPIAKSSLIWSGKRLPTCFRKQIWS
jgi:tRNA-splicing ligase RtcB